MCPVCGFEEFNDLSVKDEYGCPTFEICPCCGTEFGYSDATRSHEELRQDWLNKGAKWWDESEPPLGWNPYKQLEKAFGIK